MTSDDETDDGTITVIERWFRDGRGIRKIGDGPWEPIENFHGRTPFMTLEQQLTPQNFGGPMAAVSTDYSKHTQQRITAADLDNMFTYHAPKGDQQERYANLREIAKELAILMVKYCPPCADTTAAIRQLRESVMSANAAICNE